MSIKRSRQSSTRSPHRGAESFSFAKPPEPEKTWDEHMAGRAPESFAPYSFTSSYAKGALIAHTKFGNGVVLKVDGGHIEVLFSDGKKVLGHAHP
jgi:hypothetical protein